MADLENIKKGDEVVVVNKHGDPYKTEVTRVTSGTVVTTQGLRFYRNGGTEKTSFATSHIEVMTDEWREEITQKNMARKINVLVLDDWRKVSFAHLNAITAMLKEDGVIS